MNVYGLETIQNNPSKVLNNDIEEEALRKFQSTKYISCMKHT